MAGEKQDLNWPLPKFYFRVDWGSQTNLAFQEISGLETETQSVDYRAGDSSKFYPIKMPGLVKFGNITLKKGVFTKEKEFWEWHNRIKMNTIKRQVVTIKLLDEKDNIVKTWSVKNALPTKISSTDLKSEGNEVAIESLEIVHEGLTIVNG